MQKKDIKTLVLIVAIPILILLAQIYVIRPIAAMILSGSSEYAYRSYVWGASDIQDYEKFPYREIQNAGPVYEFKTAAPSGRVPARPTASAMRSAGPTTW